MIYVDVHMGITVRFQRLWIFPKIGIWLQRSTLAYLFLLWRTYWLKYSS